MKIIQIYKMKVDHRMPSENAAEFHNAQDDVFGRIAHRYDLLCDLFSLGIHRLWKRRVARRIADESWANLLDCAAGTGDITLRVLNHKKLQTHQRLIISDISPQMLAIARKRLGTTADSLDFRLLNAESMPEIPDESIDIFSISLCLKICDRRKAFQEALRVLRPGGRFISLEASTIAWPWLNKLYLLYMNLCMPLIGWMATGGDRSAYQYLLKGIEGFPGAEALAGELAAAGFENISFERLSLGIVAIHSAHKPESA
jgi:demethylmenaquinone methyltransferase / 2-methoxy-6-polyprenyl-1,4-benzoquinol methylase